jgi:hypothetical protein
MRGAEFVETKLAAKRSPGLCQNCVRYHMKPRSNSVIYGDTPRHIVVVEVVNGECVGGCRCASARAAGVYFQACSFNHLVTGNSVRNAAVR